MPDFSVDNVWYRIKKMAGQCAANTDVEDLKASVELAKGRVDKALMAGRIVQKDSKVFDKLSNANEGLGAIGESLDKVQNACMDIHAIGQIHDAVKKLGDDRLIYDDPDAAAEAFDSMFQGFGRLCRHLPPPATQWGEFFSQFNLFSSVQKNIYKPYFDRLNNIGKDN